MLSSPLPNPTFSDSTTKRKSIFYGPNCTICQKYWFNYKKDSKPKNVTLEAAAKRICESAAEKQHIYQYKDLYFEILSKPDLIAAEFKCHDECRRNLTRPIIAKPQQSNVNDRENVNLNNVINYIDQNVIVLNQCVGIPSLEQLYSVTECSADTKRKRRSRLIQLLKRHYEDKILIITQTNSPGIVVNSSNLDKHVTINTDENALISLAASYIRKDIDEYSKTLLEKPMNWPPSIEELMSNDRLPPPSVVLFLTDLLKSQMYGVTAKRKRLIDSYAYDLIHGATNGRIITPKHFLLGLSLHNLTGQKKIVQVTNRFGNCITYDQVVSIESAHAKQAQMRMASSEDSLLPLKPATSTDYVPTIFWVDNFDKV